MKEDSIHLTGRSAGVLLFAVQRVTGQGELYPDLILDPSLEDDLHERAGWMPLHYEPVQDSLLSLTFGGDVHPKVAGVLGQVVDQFALVQGRNSLHPGQVATLGRALTELSTKMFGRRLVPSEDHEPRDVPVQTVHGMDEAPLGAQEVEEAGIRRALGALDQQARALVHYQVAISGVDHAESSFAAAVGANASLLPHAGACPMDGFRGRGLMTPDLPLVVTGAGLSGCIGRWFADLWPGQARFVGPGYFLRSSGPVDAQLLVLSQRLSPHARLAIRAGATYRRCVVCGAVDPRALLPQAQWRPTVDATESGLRIEGPLAQVEALQALLSDPVEDLDPEAELSGPPVALLHDGRPGARLFAELTAWTLLEHLGSRGARAFDGLDFAHGGLQALPKARTGEIWFFGVLEPRLRRVLEDGVAPHRLRSAGLGPDAWRTVVRHIKAYPPRGPFASDGPFYALEEPLGP